ncbi:MULTISPECIES: response regulator [unclassified Duganella]|uniref:response regulator n=1 Tax=unclassified Duganella TaxID=2636909 RepID=UPI000E351976|nr:MULTISPECIES: response regulator [unclassified Duganella]RFP19668.1 response regulator [Duganella sp. BJB475]RFP36692.1 response regulator [Duganella sp. BJB476]
MARILIVEDTPGNMLLTSIMLESDGHTLYCAERARAGIDIAREQLPDLILMDVQMPELDGIAAVAILKGDPRTQAIPVVALTAYVMKGDRERMLAAGFDSYIEKPIDYDSFMAEVTRILGPA